MDSKDNAINLIKYFNEIENLSEEGLRRLQKEMRRYNGL